LTKNKLRFKFARKSTEIHAPLHGWVDALAQKRNGFWAISFAVKTDKENPHEEAQDFRSAPRQEQEEEGQEPQASQQQEDHGQGIT
jgi:hypothetical protein